MDFTFTTVNVWATVQQYHHRTLIILKIQHCHARHALFPARLVYHRPNVYHVQWDIWIHRPTPAQHVHWVPMQWTQLVFHVQLPAVYATLIHIAVVVTAVTTYTSQVASVMWVFVRLMVTMYQEIFVIRVFSLARPVLSLRLIARHVYLDIFSTRLIVAWYNVLVDCIELIMPVLIVRFNVLHASLHQITAWHVQVDTTSWYRIHHVCRHVLMVLFWLAVHVPYASILATVAVLRWYVYLA